MNIKSGNFFAIYIMQGQLTIRARDTFCCDRCQPLILGLLAYQAVLLTVAALITLYLALR